jgi:starch synthase
MNVIHLSAECYPVAKVGGLGDVVGALPKYQNALGIKASVVMPYYNKKFVKENSFDNIFEGTISLGILSFNFQILKEATDKLGFQLFLIHIPQLLDREEVYGYRDETEQFVAFQLAFLEWTNQLPEQPDLIHCHDHHTGLIPFLMNYSFRYRSSVGIPTVFTVHNAEYQGWFSRDKLYYLPDIDLSKTGMLDWHGIINPLAAAIKCCWRFTTVSPSYLKQLSYFSNGLEYLFESEKAKGLGILNGIDTQVWNPKTDHMLVENYDINSVEKGKKENKHWLCNESGLSLAKPLIAFIGRFAGEKGADLLPNVITETLTRLSGRASFVILGSGDKAIEEKIKNLKIQFDDSLHIYVGYNEELAHKIYAATDFLLMPSKVEPCGLNQFYAMQYGSVPIVRSTGGLKDTVIDFESENGYGICFEQLEVESAFQAIDRGVDMYANSTLLQLLRKRMMTLDFSWDKSANQYINLYNNLIS